jgi:hypothetical protein
VLLLWEFCGGSYIKLHATTWDASSKTEVCVLSTLKPIRTFFSCVPCHILQSHRDIKPQKNDTCRRTFEFCYIEYDTVHVYILLLYMYIFKVEVGMNFIDIPCLPPILRITQPWSKLNPHYTTQCFFMYGEILDNLYPCVFQTNISHAGVEIWSPESIPCPNSLSHYESSITCVHRIAFFALTSPLYDLFIFLS